MYRMDSVIGIWLKVSAELGIIPKAWSNWEVLKPPRPTAHGTKQEISSIQTMYVHLDVLELS